MSSLSKLTILYYSATGHIYQLAQAMQDEAERLGAAVRLRKVRETVPLETIRANAAWLRHVEQTYGVAEATLDDVEWADALLLGTPTRFGGPAAQLKAFIDATGPLWAQGKLANKTASGFTSAGNPHGGQESTLLVLSHVFYHWGCDLVPPGYTDPAVAAAGGNPYGTSLTATREGTVPAEALAAARYQCRRLLDATQRLTATLPQPAALRQEG